MERTPRRALQLAPPAAGDVGRVFDVPLAARPARVPASGSMTARTRKFLVVVDRSSESRVAVRFATRRAQHTGGRVMLLCIAEAGDFQQWRGVEEIMMDEARQEAEALLQDAARIANELAGILPEFVIAFGHATECLLNVIREDRDISILVLAAATAHEGPGPLVSLFAGPGQHPIPVTIVPGGLTDDEIDMLA
jgi:nucleotide-binding universal stress UspA family protein